MGGGVSKDVHDSALASHEKEISEIKRKFEAVSADLNGKIARAQEEEKALTARVKELHSSSTAAISERNKLTSSFESLSKIKEHRQDGIVMNLMKATKGRQVTMIFRKWKDYTVTSNFESTLEQKMKALGDMDHQLNQLKRFKVINGIQQLTTRRRQKGLADRFGMWHAWLLALKDERSSSNIDGLQNNVTTLTSERDRLQTKLDKDTLAFASRNFELSEEVAQNAKQIATLMKVVAASRAIIADQCEQWPATNKPLSNQLRQLDSEITQEGLEVPGSPVFMASSTLVFNASRSIARRSPRKSDLVRSPRVAGMGMAGGTPPARALVLGSLTQPRLNKTAPLVTALR